jgi:DNA-binding MarR family transcriptional regulator
VAEPNWLDDREQRVWRSFYAMRRALDRAIDRQLLEAGLSSADYDLLVPLSEAPAHELRARDLGKRVDWDRSRLSHQLRRMEQRGLISRHDCEDDARGTMITLADEGLRAVTAAAPGHVDVVRRYFVDLLSPTEGELLTALATKVLAAAGITPD